MTALLDLHPDAGHPAVVGLHVIHEALDGRLAGGGATVPLASHEYARPWWPTAIARPAD